MTSAEFKYDFKKEYKGIIIQNRNQGYTMNTGLQFEFNKKQKKYYQYLNGLWFCKNWVYLFEKFNFVLILAVFCLKSISNWYAIGESIPVSTQVLIADLVFRIFSFISVPV